MAHGSEGLLLAAVYECAPFQMFEAAVGACVKANPSLTSEFDAALRSWKLRNATLADEATKSCLALPAQAAKSAEERDAMVQQMHQNVNNAIAAVEADIQKNPESCATMLSDLRNKSSDFRPRMRGVR
jgi:hypothetical protein